MTRAMALPSRVSAMGGLLHCCFIKLFVLCVLAAPLLSRIGAAQAETPEDRQAELLQLQSRSNDGVIRMNEGSFQRFMIKARPYSLVLYFDASQLRGNSELRLEELRKEFGLVSEAYRKHNEGQPAAAKVFFCELEFKQSQGVFQLFGVQSLPHVRYVPMGSGDHAASVEMGHEFPRSAEGMASFVTAKTGHKCGPIERPPSLSRKQMWVLIALFLASAPFVVKKMVAPESPLRVPRVWLTGALIVYFFSVSGGMHNIIRKMPLFMQDRNNPGKFVYFYHGSGMQLGAEGFVVGFLYTIVGVLLGFATHIAPRIPSKIVQRLVMLAVITISFVAVRKVIALDNWKTGYWVHAYWPSRWT